MSIIYYIVWYGLVAIAVVWAMYMIRNQGYGEGIADSIYSFNEGKNEARTDGGDMLALPEADVEEAEDQGWEFTDGQFDFGGDQNE